MKEKQSMTDLGNTKNSCFMDIITVSLNFNPNSKDYDERGIGIHYYQGRYVAVVLRTYF
jgi:hypothetical protein